MWIRFKKIMTGNNFTRLVRIRKVTHQLRYWEAVHGNNCICIRFGMNDP